ncbi:2-nitropropane dioxygenase [Chloroflexus islandicus]|uniref:2-nitropropane dioxygenase n=1 Tax=Chloroflexus islandicus TaxID=1707952 RepID=A0A178MIA9_9CHLR|nr:nitronate monooxygenase [Chloroflexus islandicus]OAN47805.1 2-nitropropane dioxygenase [Chloroflexus islandicus]
MRATDLPMIIQGGMGAAVSDWRLARAVAACGQLGVVSGTGIDTILIRRLQDGDPDGAMRRAMAHFPVPGVAERVLEAYFRPEGRAPDEPYALLPMYNLKVSKERQQVAMLAAFVEVWLAKEGHDRPIGMNLLTKIQLPNLALLYGALLAGVDVIIMGAGIPREIPAALDALAANQPARLTAEIEGDDGAPPTYITFEPAEHWPGEPPALRRPLFLPIVASVTLATMFARKIAGVDGLVIEGPTAGGHNAPPRGELQLNERGEPIYGPRDLVDPTKIAALGLPFWLAGGTASPEGLAAARAAGAMGIQVGTLFAFCTDSGLADPLRRSVLEAAARDAVDVFTDPRASPTGYPFKVVRWDTDPAQGVPRQRICDLGYLRTMYRTPKGTIGYRCASEPVATFVKKGGDLAETEGRRCLCNALMANIGVGQARADIGAEPPLLTSGDDLVRLRTIFDLTQGYSAADVIAYLLGERPAMLSFPAAQPAEPVTAPTTSPHRR